MARPNKEGMDYFPHDTDACSDEKIEVLRTLYGNDGYAFYFIMLERIYRTNNFQINVSEAETREETFQILSKKVSVSQEKFIQMLNTALKWGCFDKDLYDNDGIITSLGIKKRAATVVNKRKAMKDKYEKSKLVSEAETREETMSETPQSKVKESKEKNNIYIVQSEQLWSMYPEKKGKDRIIKKIPELIKEYGLEQMQRTIERYLKYVDDERKRGFDLHYKNGSTFFNEGYKDYLDSSLPQELPIQPKPRKTLEERFKD